MLSIPYKRGALSNPFIQSSSEDEELVTMG